MDRFFLYLKFCKSIRNYSPAGVALIEIKDREGAAEPNIKSSRKSRAETKGVWLMWCETCWEVEQCGQDVVLVRPQPPQERAGEQPGGGKPRGVVGRRAPLPPPGPSSAPRRGLTLRLNADCGFSSASPQWKMTRSQTCSQFVFLIQRSLPPSLMLSCLLRILFVLGGAAVCSGVESSRLMRFRGAFLYTLSSRWSICPACVRFWPAGGQYDQRVFGSDQLVVQLEREWDPRQSRVECSSSVPLTAPLTQSSGSVHITDFGPFGIISCGKNYYIYF